MILLIGCCHAVRAQVVIALLFGDKLNTDQVEFGLVVTPALTNMTNTDGKARTALNLGLYFNIKINDNLFLHPEATAKGAFGAKDLPVYSTGNDSLDQFYSHGSLERKIKGFSLPLLLRFRIHKLFFGMGGIQADWMLKTKDVFTTQVNGHDLDYTIKVKDEVTKFDLGVTAGLEYKLKKDKGMGFGIRYYYGVTDILINEPGEQLNTAWFFNVSIPIGTGKSNGQQAATKSGSK